MVDNNTTDLIKGINNLSKISRFEMIYKWHNGLMLEQQLKYMTEDESYTLDLKDLEDRFKFKNKDGLVVAVDNDGYVLSPKGKYKSFERLCIKRLDSTEKMIDMLPF